MSDSSENPIQSVESSDSGESTAAATPEVLEVEVSIAGNSNSSKRRSPAYDHYTEESSQFECNYCKKKVQKEKHGGTGNLLKHLRKHPWVKVETTKSKQELKQVSILESLKAAEEAYSSKRLERMVLDHIILSNQPFSLIEEETFMKLLVYGRVIPPTALTARAVRDQVLRLYDVERNKLVTKMKNIPGKISLIVDGWKSSNMQSFEGIMATWITPEWDYEHVVLDFDVVNGSHTGKALAESLYNVLETFGLESKVLAITTDNAGNMVTMCEELSHILSSPEVAFDSVDFHVRCLAHILNLSCQSSLKVLKNASPSSIAMIDNTTEEEAPDEDVISPCSNISVYSRIRESFKIMRKSDPLRESLRNFCDSFKIGYLEPIIDMPVRWNSTFKMLQRALKLKKPLDAVMRNSEKLSKMVLSETEWILVEEMANFLKPFSVMTEKVSVQGLPTLSLVALIYYELYQHIKSYNDSSEVSDGIKEAAAKAKEKLDEYYQKSDALVYVVGLVLDPRCKLVWYNSVGFSHMTRHFRKVVTDHWEAHYKSRDDGDTVEAESDAGDLFDMQMKRAKFDTKDELKKYLSEPPVRSATLPNGPLGWWKTHESVFPNLSRMARDFLAVSGTGVPIEATFSMGTDVVTNKRHRLSKETIRALMSLKSWLKFNTREDFREAVASEIINKMRGGDEDSQEIF